MKKGKKDNAIKILLDESKYYDKEKVELRAILNNINLKSKIIVDVGAGVGRLSLPLIKYAENITSLDSNYKLKKYYKTIKNSKLRFICREAEKYLRNKKFDIYIFAWPPLDKRVVEAINKSMKDSSRLIVFIPKNNSEFESIVERIGVVTKRESAKYNRDKRQFLNFLGRKFKVVKRILLKTKYTYQNEFIAFNRIKENIEFWYDVKLSTKQLNRLNKVIDLRSNHTVSFDERVYFYILKK